MTHHTPSRKRTAASVSAIVGVGILLAGCAGSATAEPDTSSTPAPLADLVPAEFAGGTIRGVVGDNNPPLYLRDSSGEVVGITSEIAQAAAELLGIEIESEVQPFDTVLPGLQNGKYDIGLYGIDVRPERLEVIDIVSYIHAGYGLLAYDDDESRFGTTTEDLCGLRLGGITGNAGVAEMKQVSEECAAEGESAIDVQEYKDQASANLAVQSGQLDAAIVALLSGAYVAENDPEWMLVGPEFGVSAAGMAFTKGSGLAEAFAAAINELIADGTYDEIFASYGAQVGMTTQAEVHLVTP